MSLGGALAVAVVAAIATIAPGAAAHQESAAQVLRPDVAAVGHTPEAPAPHSQWSGFLALRPGSNVTAASFQICRVGSSCFAPPAPALRDGDTFRFNTSSYLADGRAVDYQAGWRVGVVWFLTEGTGLHARNVTFPVGKAAEDPACLGAAALACQEDHYFAFDMPAAAAGTPSLTLPACALLVAAAACLRSRHG